MLLLWLYSPQAAETEDVNVAVPLHVEFVVLYACAVEAAVLVESSLVVAVLSYSACKPILFDVRWSAWFLTH